MIWHNAQIFNADDLERQPDGFYAVRRLKDPEREFECDNVFYQNKLPYGVEVRFRLNGDKALLVCRTEKGEIGRCWVYLGQTLLGEYTLTERPAEIPAEMTVEETVRQIERAKNSPFGERIVRILFDGAQIALGKLEGDVSLPEKADLPKIRGLIHGSSITAGYSSSFLPALSYVRVAERALGAEIENLGFPGVCLIEEWIARRIGGRGKYDFIALELGVNVMWQIDEEEFARRVRRFIAALRELQPTVPLICTDCFPFAYWQAKIPEKKYRAFKRAVKEAVLLYGGKNSAYADGETLLSGVGSLSADGVHPDVFGHIEIGTAFARRIAECAGLQLRPSSVDQLLSLR